MAKTVHGSVQLASTRYTSTAARWFYMGNRVLNWFGIASRSPLMPPAIVSGNSGVAVLYLLQIYPSGGISLYPRTNDSNLGNNVELTEAFEQRGGMKIAIGSYSVEVNMNNVDSETPYLFSPLSSAERTAVAAFSQNVRNAYSFHILPSNRFYSSNMPAVTVEFFTNSTPPPSFGSAVIPRQHFVQNEIITTFRVPEATAGGSGALTYAASGLPQGLVFNASSRAVTGRPTTLGTGTATIEATEADGGTSVITFEWVVSTLGLAASIGSITLVSWGSLNADGNRRLLGWSDAINAYAYEIQLIRNDRVLLELYNQSNPTYVPKEYVSARIRGHDSARIILGDWTDWLNSPDAPTGFTAPPNSLVATLPQIGSPTYTGSTVSWDDQDGAGEHQVQLRDRNKRTATKTLTGSSVTNIPDRYIEARVRGKNTSGDTYSDWSEWVQKAATAPSDTTPGAPRNEKVEVYKSRSSILVQWAGGEGKYRLRRRASVLSSWSTVIDNYAGNEHEIDGLLLGSSLQLELRCTSNEMPARVTTSDIVTVQNMGYGPSGMRMPPGRYDRLPRGGKAFAEELLLVKEADGSGYYSHGDPYGIERLLPADVDNLPAWQVGGKFKVGDECVYQKTQSLQGDLDTTIEATRLVVYRSLVAHRATEANSPERRSSTWEFVTFYDTVLALSGVEAPAQITNPQNDDTFNDGGGVYVTTLYYNKMDQAWDPSDDYRDPRFGWKRPDDPGEYKIGDSNNAGGSGEQLLNPELANNGGVYHYNDWFTLTAEGNEYMGMSCSRIGKNSAYTADEDNSVFFHHIVGLVQAGEDPGRLLIHWAVGKWLEFNILSVKISENMKRATFSLQRLDAIGDVNQADIPTADPSNPSAPGNNYPVQFRFTEAKP